MARRAPRPHARPEGDLRRSDPALFGQCRTGGGHQGQPDLPEPDRLAVGHPGVHGHGEALRAGRGGGVRRGGGGHPPHPQRPGLPRRPAPPDPVSGEPGVSGADEAHPGRAQVRGCGRPGPAADHLTGGRAPRSSTTRWPSSRPSRAWRRGSGPGRRGSGSCWSKTDTAFILVASPRPDSVDEAVHFAGKLAESDMAVTALVVNRVQPRFADDAQLASLPARCRPDPARAGPSDPAAPLEQLVDNLRGYTDASDREEQALGDLVAKVAPGPGVPGAPPEQRCPRPRRAWGPSPTCLFPGWAPAGSGRGSTRSANLVRCVPSLWPATLRRFEPRWRRSPEGPTSPSGRPGPGPR